MVASISTQMETMQVRYPGLVAKRLGNSCLWTGRLAPFRKEYLIQITYTLPLIPTAFSLIMYQPAVTVLTPRLERHDDYEEGPIPHIYPNPGNRDLPRLCLFDPYKQEWAIDSLIAETTVPWTERWLGNYEFWLATTLWRGGGVHYASSDFGSGKPDMPTNISDENTSNANSGQQPDAARPN